jgi:hypothetical protein
MEKQQFETLCAAYALGIIEPEEQSLLDEALASGSEEFRRMFREAAGVSHSITVGVKQALPSPAVRSRILKQIQFGDRSPSPIVLWFEKLAILIGFGRPGFGLLVALLLLIVIVELGAYAYVSYGELDAVSLQFTAAETLLTNQEQRLQTAAEALGQKDEILRMLLSGKSESVPLTGRDSSVRGSGTVIWDPVRKIGLLHLSGFSTPPAGMKYRLWMVDRNNAAVNAGEWTLSDSTEHFLPLASVPFPAVRTDIGSFVLMLETAAAAQQPAGTVLLSGDGGPQMER